MNSFVALFSVVLGLFAACVNASEPGHCPQCEINREYNATHPNKCMYYEDYLKDLKGKEVNSQKSEDESQKMEDE